MRDSINVTPLFRFVLCPDDRSESRDNPCYVLTMLRHDATPAPTPRRSWWLVVFDRSTVPLKAPWWKNSETTAVVDADRTGWRP